jgi:quercetin dioxygenase-like cupin family protein
VMIKIASALGVTIEELIGPPRATGRLYRSDQLPVKRRAGVLVKRLLPDPLPNIELERFSLPAGARWSGVPHSAGTREYLFCESGAVVLVASGTAFSLDAGDVVVFRGDQRHSYQNPGDTEATAFSVVLFPPPGA